MNCSCISPHYKDHLDIQQTILPISIIDNRNIGFTMNRLQQGLQA
jgi:hypothetical protein